MLLGAHVSTAGGMRNAVTEAVEIGCEAIQVFTRNQKQWFPRALDAADVDAYRSSARAAGYDRSAVSHASYLINLCALDETTLARSRTAFVDEIERCAALGIPYLCVHPGSHVGAGEQAGLRLIAESVSEALRKTEGKRVRVLLENTAGQGTNLGYRLEHLQELLSAVGSRRVGVCIDTCHLFAAGYDFRSAAGYEQVMDELDARIGLDQVHAFHLNDSKHPCGSRKDRHEHIGRGSIGPRAFGRLVRDERFRKRPGLLETPEGPAGYEENLARLRRMRRR